MNSNAMDPASLDTSSRFPPSAFPQVSQDRISDRTSAAKTAEKWSKFFGLPPLASTPLPADRRPRRLTAQGATMDYLLAHAIEYLTDARDLPSGRITELPPENPDVQAIVLLMEARHQIYLASPLIERRSIFGRLRGYKGPERRRS